MESLLVLLAGCSTGNNGAAQLDGHAGADGNRRMADMAAGADGLGAICSTAGTFCGSDGVTGGAPNALYSCPGKGQAPTSTMICASGCMVNGTGLPDSCKSPSGGPSCPAAGSFCGDDGVTGGTPTTLYGCPGAGMPPSSSMVCPAGCQIEPSGSPDQCKAATTLSCPGAGSFCGSDGVTGGVASTLYTCSGAGMPPSSSTACPAGCQTGSAGMPDQCKSLACPGAGSFCGNDGVTGGSASTLYTCGGAGTAPSSSTPCASGCQVEPAGTPDQCKGTTTGLACPGGGLYCGSDGVTGGASSTLYSCPGAGLPPSSSTVCAAGCQTEPAGTADQCKIVCPGAGSFCGSDGVTGGAASTLYQCPGSGMVPTSSTVCSAGCQTEPSGTADQCKAPPGGPHLWIAFESTSCATTVEDFFHCLLEHTNFDALATSYSTGYAVTYGGQATIPSSCGADFQCAVNSGGFPVGDHDVVLILVADGSIGGMNNWDVYVNSGGKSVHIHGAHAGDAGGNCNMQTAYGMHEVYEATSDPAGADCCDGEIDTASPFGGASGCLDWCGSCSYAACGHYGPGSCGGDNSYGLAWLTCSTGKYMYQIVSPGSDEFGGTCDAIMVTH